MTQSVIDSIWLFLAVLLCAGYLEAHGTIDKDGRYCYFHMFLLPLLFRCRTCRRKHYACAPTLILSSCLRSKPRSMSSVGRSLGPCKRLGPSLAFVKPKLLGCVMSSNEHRRKTLSKDFIQTLFYVTVTSAKVKTSRAKAARKRQRKRG